MGKPTSTNKNSWYNGRIPDVKLYQCAYCNAPAERFWMPTLDVIAGKPVYTALCNACHAVASK